MYIQSCIVHTAHKNQCKQMQNYITEIGITSARYVTLICAGLVKLQLI